MPLENSQPSDDGFNTGASIICGGAGTIVGGVLGYFFGGAAGGAIGFTGMLAGPQIGVPTTLLGVQAGGEFGMLASGALVGSTASYLCGEFVPIEW